MESREPFSVRHRRLLILGTPVAAVILSVLFYNVTKPKSAQSTGAGGREVAASELLQVGALPVT